MPEESGMSSGRAVQDDRFYVQLDKHTVYQAWGKDDATAPLPMLKDAFVFAACVGWSNDHRVPLGKRQHVGFWRSFDSRDRTILQAIAIAATGDPTVVARQGEVIAIAEEYSNGGIDLLMNYERSDRERTLVALAGLVQGETQLTASQRRGGGRPKPDTSGDNEEEELE